jgi:hypothetical protein
MSKKVYNEIWIPGWKNTAVQDSLFQHDNGNPRIQIRKLSLQATVALASGSFQTIAIENRDHSPMVGNDTVISQHVTKVRYTGSPCAEML